MRSFVNTYIYAHLLTHIHACIAISANINTCINEFTITKIHAHTHTHTHLKIPKCKPSKLTYIL